MLFKLTRILLLTDVLLTKAAVLFSQSTSATYTPGSGRNGPEIRVTLAYRFVNVFGEVDIPMSAQVEAFSDAY